ncbi:MAG: NUDIX hydrolase [Planktomarina sp.]
MGPRSHCSLVIKRDDKKGIPWPNHWDFPGGGREAVETPIETVLRETREEVGLILSAEDFVWEKSYIRSPVSGHLVWFFVAHMPAETAQAIQLGDEGQSWALMSADEYIAHPLRIPHFADRLREYLTAYKTPNRHR